MRSTASRAPYKLFSAALIAAVVLSATSCRSTRTVTKESRQETSVTEKDSTVDVRSETRLWWTEPVKADTALLEIALDTTLWQLPEGVGYTASSGRAHVKASVKRSTDGKPPTLVIESGCDSLERLCLMYEAENERLSVANQHLRNDIQTADERHSKHMETWVWVILIVGIVAGIVITILTRRIWQKVF